MTPGIDQHASAVGQGWRTAATTRYATLSRAWNQAAGLARWPRMTAPIAAGKKGKRFRSTAWLWPAGWSAEPVVAVPIHWSACCLLGDPGIVMQ